MEIDSNLISKAVKALVNYEEKKDSSSYKNTLIENFSKPIIAQASVFTIFS